MYECSVCGLLFLGGSACPSCGSLSSQELDVSGEGKETVDQRGGIPGLSELDDAMRDVVGEDEMFGETEEVETVDTSLPFTIGGGATEEISNLPFGVGSRSMGISIITEENEEVTPISEADGSESDVEEVSPVAEVSKKVELTEVDTSSDSPPNPELPPTPPPAPTAAPVSPPEPLSIPAPPPPPPPVYSESMPPLPNRQIEDSFSVENLDEDAADEPPLVKAEPVEVVEEVKELEQVPLPKDEKPSELETVPLPIKADKPVKVKAIAIIDDHESASDSINSFTEESAISVLSEAEDGHYQIQATAVDMEELYAEPEHIVEHSFESEELTSEVEVNLDDYPEEIASDAIFAPELVSAEPELFPAQALEIITNGDPEMDSMLSVGFNALASGHWDQAARSFRSMAAKRPGNASILNNYGLALLQHAVDLSADSMSDFNVVDSQYEAAIMALRQAAKSNPEEALILYNLGTALVSSGRHEKAIRILDVVLERVDSPKVPTFNARAAAHMGMGSFDNARSDLNSALKIDPSNQIVRNNMARVSPA